MASPLQPAGSESVQSRYSDRNLLLMDFLGCIIEGKQAVYVSTPITTGPRYMNWLRRESRSQNEELAMYQQEVINPNLTHGRELVCRIRSHFMNRVVIDPTAVRLPGWEQGDYHELWGGVIERYARMVVLGDGWEYSYGCAYEFLIAHRGHTDVVDERFHGITAKEGLDQIRQAAHEYQVLGVFPSVLNSFISQLAQLCSEEDK